MARYETAPATHHALFAPLHYESNYAYPLLVWLHGSGDSEVQLRRIMPLVSMRNYVAIAPRGVANGAESTGRDGYSWQQSEEHVMVAGARVERCIRLARKRFHVASDRIFLAGYAEGGSMALRLALTQPDRFAGTASLGGAFPTGNCPLRRLNDVRRLPLLLATGRDSVKYNQQQVVGDLRLLHSAGMSLTLRQYPCGDELTTTMLADLDRWMMQLVCPSCVSPSDEAGS
jgi:phospholipase/carboxylesterase